MLARARLPGQTEVLVIGGGPAGLAAALALRQLGIATVLLDTGRVLTPVGETLPPGAKPALDRLGLHRNLEQEGHLRSIGTWSAWGGAEPWGRDHLFGRFGHGWHLDRRRFNALLRETARAAGSRLIVDTVVGSERLPGGAFRVTLARRGAIVAPVVLDASGRSAVFARLRGVRRQLLDRMVAMVLFVQRRPDAPVEPAATLVEATADGWWYSAPLPQERMSIVFLTDTDLARGRDSAGWLARMAAAPLTGARAARYGAGLAGPPMMVPAASGTLERLGGRGWLAIGDAAATQDPLSSEGLSVALESGIDGALAAARALAGDTEALPAEAARSQQRWRSYLAARDANYSMEPRWSNAPFWRRRQGNGRDAAWRSIA